MGLLIIRLITFLNSQPPESTNYHIATIMLKNYEQVQASSISQIAELCNVSKSTISKFARQLGFDDYYDLKDNAAFIENRFNNPLNYLSNILTPLAQEGVDTYVQAVIKDIHSLHEQLNLTDIDNVAKALHAYEDVVAFGLMFSESAAIDMQYKLAYNGKFIRTFQDDVIQEQFLKEASDQTLVIIFTNSGDYLTKQQIKLGTPRKDLFSKTKAKIIVISANPSVRDLDFVSDAVIFPHQTTYQTHAIIYQMITDLIVSRYRALSEN